MTYRIEVTADTVSELIGRVLALAAEFQTAAPVKGITTATSLPVAPKPKAAPKPAPAPEPEPVIEEVEAEVVEEAAAPEPEPQPEPQPEPAPAPAAPAASSEIDFTTEITPRIVKVVAECGRERMAEILGQFGAAKASHLDPERLPELIAALDDAVAGKD